MAGAHGTAHSVEHVAAGSSVVHRLDPRAKIVGLIGLVIVAVTTPEGAWIAFAAYGLGLLGLAVLARLPLRYTLLRMTVEIPFLAAAALLPFTREDGLVLGASIAAKTTISTLAMVILSSTTPFPRLLLGFEALRMPRLIVMIVAFMWRYLHVIGEELARMKIARESRGYDARWVWRMRAVATSVATLFVRTLERGERVYLAMLSRGYTGALPTAVGDQLVLGRVDVAFLALLAAGLAAVRVAAS